MARVFDISDYTPKTSENYFFDNNVWMFLFCPLASYDRRKQDRYSRFFQQLVSGKQKIFINSLVLSEFANAYLRIDFNLWKAKKENAGKGDYKRDFVGTNQFLETTADIKISIRKILAVSERMTDNFNAIQIENVFSEFGRGDFNDAYYLELARMNRWKVVTDDGDLFRSNKLDIDIITANI